MGDAVGRTSIVLSKTPISERMWRIKTNEADQPFSPAHMVAQQRAQGRAVKYVVQISTRPINKVAVAQAAAAAAAAAASGAAPPPPMLLGSGDVSDRSDFYAPATDLPVGCQFVHVVVDLDPAAFDPAQKLLDPRQRACPITASSIKRFVGIMRGIMEGIENDATKKPAAAASASSAAAAESSSSSAAAAASSPSLPLCVVLHDLYGFNLCGFLLVSFLVECYQLDVFSALNDVADSRPPGIFAPDLFQALVNRYYEPDEEAKAGAAEAARLSGAPGNKEVERLTCLPVMPELPEPEFAELPWFWSGLAAPAPIITVAPPEDSASSAAAPAAPAAEEPKRKIRKKPTPAPAPAAAASSSSAAAMTPAAASDAAWSAAAAAMAAASSAPKQPFAGFAPPAAAALPAAKKARVDGPQYSAPVAPAPSYPAAAAAAATSNRSRSPQPLFHVPAPSAPVSAAAATASSAAAAAPEFSASTLSQLIQRDHPFLQLVRAEKVSALQAALAQVMPAGSIAKYKAGGSGTDLNAMLRPPPLSLDTLRALHSGPASARAPYLLSWLPAHYACFLWVMRESVYLVFDHALFFLVPHLSFPKRKAPAERINNTLLLGELIQDRVEGGAVQSRVLVTDLLVMSQTLLLPMMGLEQRLATLDTELLQPLKLSAPSPPSQLHVRAKLMFPLAKLDSVLHMSVPHTFLGIELRMSGKDKDAAKSRGFQFVWKRDQPAGVSVADLMMLAAPAKK